MDTRPWNRGCARGLTLVLFALVTTGVTRADEKEWSQWRGPYGNGMAEGDALVAWSATENVKWKVPVPGRACSTPVIHGGRLFLTTAVPTGKGPAAAEGEPEAGGGRRRGNWHGGGGPQAEQSFELLCLDRATGATRWKKTAVVATPHAGFHGTYGSHASAPPATDGDCVVAFFGSRGVYCYDLAGELRWQRDFEVEMEIRAGFGEGCAPVIHGDAVILNFDHEGDSFLVVLDRRTGDVRWRVAREEITTWATPLVVEYDGTEQVVVSGSNRVRSYDLATGAVIWECGGLGVNAIPVPARAGDSVLVMSGYRGANLMAIQLGGEGDLTDTDAVLWSSSKGASYTASPVLAGNRFYALGDRGFLSCFDAASGAPYFLEQRLPRGLQYKASPVGAGDKLYLVAETGEVVIVRIGDELDVVAEIPALEDELFLASPIVSGGDLFLRSMRHLFCIGRTDAE